MSFSISDMSCSITIVWSCVADNVIRAFFASALRMGSLPEDISLLRYRRAFGMPACERYRTALLRVMRSASGVRMRRCSIMPSDMDSDIIFLYILSFMML